MNVFVNEMKKVETKNKETPTNKEYRKSFIIHDSDTLAIVCHELEKNEMT